jgi:gliding motility-associated-like protein
MVTINFKVYNNGEPGTYKVRFPDGSDTLYTNVVNTATITKRFMFDCGRPPGKPTPPRSGALFFEYQGALTITREDCVDERGDNQKGSYDFRVVPNPIVDIKTSDLMCIEEPFIVNFEGKLCSEKLVEAYQWYMDGEPIEGATTKFLSNYEFGEPGAHVVKLEVTPFKGCNKYVYEKPFTIRPKPVTEINYTVDSTQLCDPNFQVVVNNTYKYATSWSWSSPSDGVTFSDPTAPNPVIDIINNRAGIRTIIVNASNAYCSSVVDTFYITTQRGQAIDILEEITTCTGYVLDLCASLNYLPTPDNIRWTADKPGVGISDSLATCPKLTFPTPGEYVMTASGSDVCGEVFNIPINIRVRDGTQLEIDITDIDTICTTEAPIALLDYVSRPDNVSRIVGPGVANNIFTPSLVEGVVNIDVIDSCGAIYPLEFTVIPQERYEGENFVICEGESIDLFAVQEADYTGTGVTDNVFTSVGLTTGVYRIGFNSRTFCGGQDSLTITVQEFPEAAFEIITETCEGGAAGATYAGLEPIYLENRSSARVICYEILETGKKECGRDKARFQFRKPGTYTLQQVVAFPDGVCNDTTRQTIEVLFPPSMDFAFTMDSTACDSLDIAFSVGEQPTGTTYDWAFTSTDRSTEAEPVIDLLRPLAPDVLGVEVGVSNACYTTEDTFGVVLPLRFRVSFDVLNDNNTVCSDDTIFLSNTSVNAFNYRVTYPDGRQTTELPRTLVLRNTNEQVMKYPVTLEGSNISCPDERATDTIYVLPITTEAAFGINYDDVCSEAEITLDNSSTPGALTFVHWGDGSTPQLIDELESIKHTYRVDRDSVFKIDLVARLCGVDTFSHTVKVRPTPDASFDFVADEANCIGKNMSFAALAPEGVFGMEWDFGDGTLSQEMSPNHVYDQAGTYTVSLQATSSNGCIDVDTFALDIGEYDGQDMDFTMPATVCTNTPFAIEWRAPLTNVWFDYGNGIAGPAPVEAPYGETGDFMMRITATSANGCTTDSVRMVKVFPGFDVTIKTAQQDTFVDLGDKLDLSVQVTPPRNITEVHWEGDSIVRPASAYTSAIPMNDGFYTVSLSDQHGCTAQDSMRVRVIKNYGDRIFVPNVFSPNDDGFNDYFGIDAKESTVKAVRNMRVLARSGAIVYECDECPLGSVNTGWDGRLGGKELQSNVYIWAAEVDFIDGTSQLFTGDVTLLR